MVSTYQGTIGRFGVLSGTAGPGRTRGLTGRASATLETRCALARAATAGTPEPGPVVPATRRRQSSFATFAAWRPFGPCVTSNCTR